MYKIIGADGQQYGPVTADQIRRWLAERRVNAQTLAQPENSPDWKPLGTIPDFADLGGPPPSLSASPAAPPLPPGYSDPRASNRIPAGICGVLLGAFGVHKFILGYTGAGLIMLLVTLLTCFIAYPVMHLIGLIEGIVYLAKPDQEFVRQYVEGRREWF
jgi:TM2 domain-containing membrane protein YozV